MKNEAAAGNFGPKVHKPEVHISSNPSGRTRVRRTAKQPTFAGHITLQTAFAAALLLRSPGGCWLPCCSAAGGGS